MVLPGRRAAAVVQYRQLLAALPSTRSVVGTLPRRNRQAREINAMIEAAATSGHVVVADLRGRTLASLRGTRAEDHFHPNELGYRTIADAFAAALALPSAARADR
jgi:lysophospholipase L1-like esterase